MRSPMINDQYYKQVVSGNSDSKNISFQEAQHSTICAPERSVQAFVQMQMFSESRLQCGQYKFMMHDVKREAWLIKYHFSVMNGAYCVPESTPFTPSRRSCLVCI